LFDLNVMAAALGNGVLSIARERSQRGVFLRPLLLEGAADRDIVLRPGA